MDIFPHRINNIVEKGIFLSKTLFYLSFLRNISVVLTAELGSQYRTLTQEIKLSPQLNFLKHWCMNFQLIMSNAFSKC